MTTERQAELHEALTYVVTADTIQRLEAAEEMVASLAARWIAEDTEKYEHAISWDTTCFNCAKLLDESYGEYAKGHEAATREITDRIETALTRHGRDGQDHVERIDVMHVRAALKGHSDDHS